MDLQVASLLRFRNMVKIAMTETEEVSNGFDGEFREVHVRPIQSQFNQLLSSMTCVDDIAVEMFQVGKITDKELENLQHYTSTPIRASEELFNLIMRKPKDVYECFLDSLKKTKQHHIHQMLTSTDCNSDIDRKFIFEHSRLIRRHYTWLSEKLQIGGGLLTHLFELEVLAAREYEDIRSRKDAFKQNEAVLSLISRKSSAQFDQFKEALWKTKQGHIAARLENGEDSDNGFKGNLKRKLKDFLMSPLSKENKNIFPRKISTKAKSKPFLLQKPTRKLMIEEHSLTSTDNSPNLPRAEKRSKFIFCAKEKTIENKLQIDISVKAAAITLRQMGSTEDLFSKCLRTILRESRNLRIEMQTKEVTITELTKIREEEKEIYNQQQNELKSVISKLADEIRLKQETELQMHHEWAKMKSESSQETDIFKTKLRSAEKECLELKASLEKLECEQRKYLEHKEKESLKEMKKMNKLDKISRDAEQEQRAKEIAPASNTLCFEIIRRFLFLVITSLISQQF